jgi:hypothetical protein
MALSSLRLALAGRRALDRDCSPSSAGVVGERNLGRRAGKGSERDDMAARK